MIGTMHPLTIAILALATLFVVLAVAIAQPILLWVALILAAVAAVAIVQ